MSPAAKLVLMGEWPIRRSSYHFNEAALSELVELHLAQKCRAENTTEIWWYPTYRGSKEREANGLEG